MVRKKPEIFVMWKKYQYYSYWDCVSQRLIKKTIRHIAGENEIDWMKLQTEVVWKMHKELIVRISNLNRKAGN